MYLTTVKKPVLSLGILGDGNGLHSNREEKKINQSNVFDHFVSRS